MRLLTSHSGSLGSRITSYIETREELMTCCFVMLYLQEQFHATPDTEKKHAKKVTQLQPP